MTRFTTLIIISICCWAFGTAYAQNPVLRSNRNLISIRDGKVYQSDYWQVDPKIKLDTYETYVKAGETKKISFISDTDSLEFSIGPEQTIRFSILLNDRDTAQTLIVAKTEIPSASFDANYIRVNDDKVSVEIPKVCELMNLVLAKTLWFPKKTDWFTKAQTTIKPFWPVSLKTREAKLLTSRTP